MTDIKDSIVVAVRLDRNKISDFVNEIIGKMTDVVKSIDVESIDLYKIGYEKGKEEGCRKFAQKVSSKLLMIECMEDAVEVVNETLAEMEGE